MTVDTIKTQFKSILHRLKYRIVKKKKITDFFFISFLTQFSKRHSRTVQRHEASSSTEKWLKMRE